MSAPIPKVYAALVAAIKLVGEGGLKKSNWNEQQKYWFRGIDDIYNALNHVLAKHGLVIIPRVTNSSIGEYTSSKGTKFTHAIVTVDYQIVCAEDASTITSTFLGEALDTGDKAVPKALSMAYKSMAIETFCIPITADDDADAQDQTDPKEAEERPAIQTPRAKEDAPASETRAAEAAPEKPKLTGKTITAGQAGWIEKRFADSGRDVAKFLKHYGIGAVAELDSALFGEARKALA